MGYRVGNIINNVRNKCIGANPEGESGPGGPPSSRSERFRVSEIKKGPTCSTYKKAAIGDLYRPGGPPVSERKLKRGPTCSTYKKAAIGDLFACGAYENRFP